MERVKEESRRKSEELEMLRNSVQQGLSYPPPEPIYSQNPIRREEITHRGLHDFESMNPIPVDDYVMDFSKPAGYQPPTQERSREVRRRSIEPTSHPMPQSLLEVMETQPAVSTRETQKAPSVREIQPIPSPVEAEPAVSLKEAQKTPAVIETQPAAPTLPAAPPRRRRSTNQSRDGIQRSLGTPLSTSANEPVAEVRSIPIGVRMSGSTKL